MKQQNKLVLGAGLVAMWIVGCASTPNEIPIEMTSDATKIKLLSRGNIVVAQKVTSGPENCKKFTQNLKIELRKEGVKGVIPMAVNCALKKGKFYVQSQAALAPGNYRVSVIRESMRWFTGDPTIYARYLNADFKSETDYMPEGATPLEPNQAVKSKTNYNKGDKSDWVRLNGKDTGVTLTFVPDDNDDDITAGVYWYSEAHNAPQLMGMLQPGKRRSFKIDQDDLYVRVAGGEFSGELEYTLLRRDTSGGKKSQLSVLDCYRVSDSSSLVLLQAVSGMKVSDHVMISGKTADGGSRTLGKCVVTSISDNQANCKLERPYSADIVEYKAEGLIKG